MASDAMTVRLHLPQIRVLEVLEDAPGALRVCDVLAGGDELLGQQTAQPAGAHRCSGHRWAHLDSSSVIERDARSLIVAASARSAPTAAAV